MGSRKTNRAVRTSSKKPKKKSTADPGDSSDDDLGARSRNRRRGGRNTLAGAGETESKEADHAYHLLTHKELCIDVEDEDLKKDRNAMRASMREGHRLTDMYTVEPLPVYALGNKHDGGGTARQLNTEEVYTEVLATGKFKRVIYQLDERGRRIANESGAGGPAPAKEHSPRALRLMMLNVASLVDAFFLLCQGILSGAVIFQLIVVYQIAEQDTFIKIYAPFALEIRRMFYFLTTLSFVGVCDKYNAESSQSKSWALRGPRERTELALYVLAYFLTLITSLLAGPYADEIGNTYRSRATPTSLGDVLFDVGAGTGGVENAMQWVEDLLASEQFPLVEWQMLITVRTIFAILGWMLLCRDVHRDLWRGRERLQTVDALKDRLDVNRKRFGYLAGQNLHELSRPQLESVREVQQRGLVEVDLQLKLS
jgi:hypothetical protein